MNHCIEHVRKYLKNKELFPGDARKAQEAHQSLGQQIIDYAHAWDAGDLPATAEKLQQIVWHCLVLSELLELPTHKLFLDVRNLHVDNVTPDIEHTLHNHFDRIL